MPRDAQTIILGFRVRPARAAQRLAAWPGNYLTRPEQNLRGAGRLDCGWVGDFRPDRQFNIPEILMKVLLSSTSTLLLCLAAPYQAAMAQAAQQQTATPAVTGEQTQAAQQCLGDLSAFAQRMDQDQFWVSGWGTAWGYGAGTAATGVPAGAVDPAATERAMAAPGSAPMAGIDPWAGAGGPFFGAQSPRNQIEVLYGAAYVLAQQGKQEGCEYVLAELTNTYDQYTAQLQQAGIDPADVTNWRQEQIALAQPVEQVQGFARFTIDDITGTDVRNLQDERLGSVSDVVLDPSTGAITYAIVARGGFLGIGQEHVAVPWNQFRATPGLNTLVLDVTQNSIENAPIVDPDSFGDPTTVTQQNQQVDQYWGQQGG
jgi:sporulation protein YlmC with PRC-barrel domain